MAGPGLSIFGNITDAYRSALGGALSGGRGAGRVSVSVKMSPSWGRASTAFVRSGPIVARATEAGLRQWGDDLVTRLQTATPVRSGFMQRSWRADLMPGPNPKMQVSNMMTYSKYVIKGTVYQKPNPAINAILDSLPADTQFLTERIIGDIIQRDLKTAIL